MKDWIKMLNNMPANLTTTIEIARPEGWLNSRSSVSPVKDREEYAKAGNFINIFQKNGNTW